MPISCSTATQKLESLQLLRTKLSSAIFAYKESQLSGDTTQTEELKTKARELKQRLETGIKELSRESNDWEYLEDEVFKNHFLGPKQIKEVFNYDIDPADIPEIPYTPEQLEKGAEDKCMLILFVPLTAQAVYERTKAKYESNPNNGKLLRGIDDNISRFRIEEFITLEIPRMQWKLVPIETLPNSIRKSYAMQTMELRDHLKSIGYLTQEEERQCTDEELERLDNLATDRQEESTKVLSNLKINQNHRLSLSEELQRIALSFLSHKIRINESMWSWTKSRSYGSLSIVGGIVTIGSRDSDGGVILSGTVNPRESYGLLALSFSY